MTSQSHKKHQTTPPNTTVVIQANAQLAAAAYEAVDQSTRSDNTVEPLWLPSGWLAVVMMLSAAVPAMGDSVSTPGWRARTSTSPTTVSPATTSSAASRHDARFRTVDYRSDIAGPTARVANRSRPQTDRVIENGYRLAQSGPALPAGDPLLDAIERPFGVDDQRNEPEELAPPTPSETGDPYDAGDLFDDLPADPFDEPMDADPADETSVDQEEMYDAEPTYTEPELTTPDYNYEEVEELAPPARSNDRLSNERAEAAEDCAEGLAKLKAHGLDDIDLTIGIAGVEGEDFPFVCSVDDGTLFAGREWAEITYMWKASALCHKPLYFEQEHLERYGHSWGPVAQPILSGAHFFGTFPVLPYAMGLKTPTECVYTLGHYRPGNCAPYMIDPIPFTWRAALFETGGVFGVAGFLP